MNENYCNNCGKLGHQYHQCKLPIISIGIIAFRKYENELQYLMIRRRDTLGFIDFMRGKYSIYNKGYIINMLKQMTTQERHALLHSTFQELWCSIWGNEVISNQYKGEESISRDKFHSLTEGVLIKTEFYTLNSLISESNQCGTWIEAEWGFPKGRRNYQETDYECALREFSEETGYNKTTLININNILPFEEIFTGSNYKSYKHKYFVAYMNYTDSEMPVRFEPTEVSKMEWKTYEECIDIIRPYNLEKKQLITNVHHTLRI